MSTPVPPQAEHSQQRKPASSQGAVDLTGLGAAGDAGGGPGTIGGRWSVNLDETRAQELIQLSSRVPVIVAVLSERSPDATALRADLVEAVEAQAGRMALGLVDADSSPQLAQAFGVQQVPTVLAILGGRPMPLFAGPVDATQIQALMQELTQLAVQQGMVETLPPLADSSAEEGGAPSRFAAAEEALAQGDYAAAKGAYASALAENPGDDEAAVALHRVELIERTAGMDVAAVRTAAAERADDLQAQLDVADLDLVGGHVEDAFRRLVSFVQAHHGDEREGARAHLVELFGVVGHQDPRVASARGRLASVLF